MDFDNLQAFEGKAKHIFETTTDGVVENILESETNDDFQVITRVKDTEIIFPDNSRQRRRMLKRSLQVASSGLRVYLDVFVYVRSGTTYTNESLIDEIKKALDSNEERENFILALQLDDVTFAPINVMNKFTINDEEIPVTQKSGGIPWMFIGPGIGAAALVVAVVGSIIYFRRRRDEMSFHEGEFFEPPMIDHRVSSTVEVDEDPGEVSTLGDPIFPYGHGMFTEVRDIENEG